MEYRPIHKNLDTSFVNLSALVKYLRRRQFIGAINVKLNGYRAEIHFNEDNTLRVSEHDEISGRIAQGEKALQRLLIRSRESGGSINVFQKVANQKAALSRPAKKSPVQRKTPAITPAHLRAVDKEIPKVQSPAVGKNGKPDTSQTQVKRTPVPSKTKQPVQQMSKPARQDSPINGTSNQPSLPNFPFELTNKFEAKAKRAMSSPQDWQTFLKLVVELLTVVDRSIAAANLDFSAEFRKICTDIGGDYPFLNPSADIFSYAKGRISMKKQMNAKVFVSGIAEALRRILIKLSRSRKYSEIYKLTSQRLQIVIGKRAAMYEKFGVTKQINRIVSP